MRKVDGGDQRLVAGVTVADRSKQKLGSYPSDLNKYRELERIDLSWNFIKVSGRNLTRGAGGDNASEPPPNPSIFV